MKTIIANEAAKSLLAEVKETTEVRDADGKILGYFTPRPVDATFLTPSTIPMVDQKILQEYVAKLFEHFDIHGTPQGALALQQEMAKAGLEPNELSRDLIAARDE